MMVGVMASQGRRASTSGWVAEDWLNIEPPGWDPESDAPPTNV
jgi:hypothetical protein